MTELIVFWWHSIILHRHNNVWLFVSLLYSIFIHRFLFFGSSVLKGEFCRKFKDTWNDTPAEIPSACICASGLKSLLSIFFRCHSALSGSVNDVFHSTLPVSTSQAVHVGCNSWARLTAVTSSTPPAICAEYPFPIRGKPTIASFDTSQRAKVFQGQVRPLSLFTPFQKKSDFRKYW